MQQTTQQLLRGVVERILKIEYQNYQVFDTTTDDIIVRSQHAAPHIAFVNEVADIVEQEASSWQFVLNLTHSDCQRLQSINQLLRDVLCKQPVRKEQLHSVLTAEQLSAYTASLHEPVTADEALYADGAPAELDSYKAWLRAADFVYNKAEWMSAQTSTGQRQYQRSTRETAHHRAETLYERALERLQEIIATATQDNTLEQLLVWFDREVDISAGGNTSPDADGVPRVKGSRSHHANPSAALPKFGVRLKRELCVLQALIKAAEKIAYLPDSALAEKQQRDSDKAKAVMAARRFPLQNVNPERD